MAKADKKKPADAESESVSPPALPADTASATLPRVVEGDGVEKELVEVGHVGPGETLSAFVEGDGTGEPLPDADPATVGPDATPLEPVAPETKPTVDDLAVVVPPPPCPKCTTERPCSRECWVKAGCVPDEFDAFIAKLDGSTSAAVVPATPPANGKRRFKVWPHGELHRNGVVFKPGADIELTDAEAVTLGCVVPIE